MDGLHGLAQLVNVLLGEGVEGPVDGGLLCHTLRAGIEGRISVLGRAFGFDLCLDHGEEGMERWVGWGILAHNLRQISRTQVARQAE